MSVQISTFSNAIARNSFNHIPLPGLEKDVKAIKETSHVTIAAIGKKIYGMDENIYGKPIKAGALTGRKACDITTLLQELFKENKGFKKEWLSFTQTRQLEFTELLLSNLKKFSGTPKEYKRLFKSSLIFLLECSKIFPNKQLSDLEDFLIFYIKHYEKHHCHAAKLILKALSEIKLNHLAFNKLLKLFSPYFEIPKSYEQIEKEIRIFLKIAKDPNIDIERFETHTIKILQIYESNSEFFYLLYNKIYLDKPSGFTADFSSYKNFINLLEYFQFYAEYGSEKGCKGLLDVYEKILHSLDTINFLIKNQASDVVEKLDPILAWISSQLDKGPSVEEIMDLGDFLDRSIALIVLDPLTANILFRAPSDFAALKDCLKEQHDLGEIDIENKPQFLQTLNDRLIKLKKTQIASHLFGTSTISFEIGLRVGKLSSLKTSNAVIHFVDRLYEIHNIDFDNDTYIPLSTKLNKLPFSCLQLIYNILEVSRNNPKIICEVFAFCEKFPYQNMINDLLVNINDFNRSDVKDKNKLAELVQTLTKLAVANPKAAYRIVNISLADNDNGLGSLKKIPSILFTYIIKNHSGWLGDPFLNPGRIFFLSEPIFQAKLKELMHIEAKHQVSLFPLFYGHELQLEEGSLINFLKDNPQICLKLIDLRTYFDNIKKLPEDNFVFWSIFNQLLVNKKNELIQIISHTAMFPLACKYLMQKLHSGDVFDLKIFDSQEYPFDKSRILQLIQTSHLDLALKIKKIYSSDKSLGHRLLDMASAKFFEETTLLIDRHENNPNDPLTKKLVGLAGSKHGALIQKFLKIKLEKNESFLVDIVVDQSTELAEKLFEARSHYRPLYEKIVQQFDLEPGQRNELFQKALEAVSKGYFSLAYTLLNNPRGYYSPVDISIHNLEKWHELTEEWHAFDRSALKPEEIQRINQLLPFAFSYLEKQPNSAHFEKWIHCIQFYLQHDPQALVTILTSPSWRNIEDPIWAFDQPALKKLFESKLKTANEKYAPDLSVNPLAEMTPLTITLAECLVTSAGNLNSFINDRLEEILSIKHPYFKDYIFHILTALKNPLLRETLKSLKEIPFPSKQHTVLAQTLGLPLDKPLTLRQGRVAVISALLWPLRQNLAGSCFGTAPMIQLSWHIDGLIILMRNLISIANEGLIRKSTSESNNGTVEYPIVIIDENKQKHFKGDHFFARTLEYSIATLGSSKNKLFSETQEQWKQLFTATFQKCFDLYEKELGTSRQILQAKALKTMIDELTSNSVLVYDGFFQHPSNLKTGAWLIIDIKTGGILFNEIEKDKFIKKCLLKTKETLISSFSQFKAAFEGVFNLADDFVSSPVALEILYQAKDFEELEGLSKINPVRFRHYRKQHNFADFRGGHCIHVLENFYSNVTCFQGEISDNPYETFQSQLSLLSDHELEHAKKGPYFKSISASRHAFNFKADQAVKLFEKRTPQEIWAEEMKILIEIEESALEEKARTHLIGKFLSCFSLEERNEIRNFLYPTSPKTVRELFDLFKEVECLIRGEKHFDGFVAGNINYSMRTMPAFTNRFPKPHYVYDTNWITHDSSFGYTYNLYEGTVKSIFSQEKTPVRGRWNPGEAHNFSMRTYQVS